MILPFANGAHVVYLDGAPTPSLLLPALKEVKPTMILSVPLIVEKIYKNKIRPMFTKNFPMQVLYSISFIRRALHRMQERITSDFLVKFKIFWHWRLKLDGVREKFLADAGFPYSIGLDLQKPHHYLQEQHPKVKWQSTAHTTRIGDKILNPNKKEGWSIVVKGPNVMMDIIRP